jgi:hypothetical protein
MTAAERKEEQRQARLAEIREQVERGELVIRQASREEIAGMKRRPVKRGEGVQHG